MLQSMQQPSGRMRLEGNHLIGWVSGERRVEIGEAAHAHPFNGVFGLTITNGTFGQAALQRALVAEHQQNVLLFGDAGQPLAQGIARAQGIGVVVEKY
jgi:hypothetical protein